MKHIRCPQKAGYYTLCFFTNFTTSSRQICPPQPGSLRVTLLSGVTAAAEWGEGHREIVLWSAVICSLILSDPCQARARCSLFTPLLHQTKWPVGRSASRPVGWLQDLEDLSALEQRKKPNRRTRWSYITITHQQ